MIKFAVGVPSLNEADNIVNLTQQVDRAARTLGIEICIINADNSSNDGTATLFKNTKTTNPKISILTNDKGKGRNVLSIFEHVASVDDIEYCFLIDADITSFDQKWLEAHYAKYKQGMDYVLPQYKRKYIEGNATNHFSYPLMRYLLNGPAPRQPIAGDIGLSRRLIEYLLRQARHSTTYGYGIDMFIFVSALSFNGTISEVLLAQKLHKPSFPKMVQIFQEEAASYYFVRQNQKGVRTKFVNPVDYVGLLDSDPISEYDLRERLDEARSLQRSSVNLMRDGESYFHRGFISGEEWAKILGWYEKNIEKYSADDLAISITPYYLLRAVSYLKSVKNPEQAESHIESQAEAIVRSLSSIGST
jgi:glycosyltransferase involved in cell wall biosynthesis